MAMQLLILLLALSRASSVHAHDQTTLRSRMLHQDPAIEPVAPYALDAAISVVDNPADDTPGASVTATDLQTPPGFAAASAGSLPSAASSAEQEVASGNSDNDQQGSEDQQNASLSQEEPLAASTQVVEDVNQQLPGVIDLPQQPVTSQFERCSTADLPVAAQAAVEAQLKSFRAEQGAAGVAVAAFTPTVVDTYIHVVSNSGGQGSVPDSQIKKQMDVLNAAFARASISFKLVATLRKTDNTVHTARMGSSAETGFKQSNRKGNAAALNVYLWEPGEKYLGWATFPSDYRSARSYDGVVVRSSTLPGGSRARFNLGDTLVHEVRRGGEGLGLGSMV